MDTEALVGMLFFMALGTIASPWSTLSTKAKLSMLAVLGMVGFIVLAQLDGMISLWRWS